MTCDVEPAGQGEGVRGFYGVRGHCDRQQEANRALVGKQRCGPPKDTGVVP